jgi:hypothetical protein
VSKLSKQYLLYLREKPCVICGAPSEACHKTGGGVSRKSSDYTAIPMCHEHHRQEHQKGVKTFWAKQKQPRSHYVSLWLQNFSNSQSKKLDLLSEIVGDIEELI